MIVNAPGVLGLLLAGVECVAGVALLASAVRGLRHAGSIGGAGPAWEPLRHLLVLLVLLLGALSAASLAVWVILLQSYVPQWADVRCLVGVFRVGTGSEGAPGWLPGLALTTTALRFSLIAAAGAGVVLHLAGRDRPEGPLPRGHLAALALTGLLAVAGSAAETAYVVIPKQAEFLSAGCCSTAGVIAADPVLPLPPGAAGTGAALYGVPALALGLLFAAGLRRGEDGGRGRRPLPLDLLLLGGTVFVLAAGFRFTGGIVAPAVMGLPLHRCSWCLLAEAPETAVGLALLALPPLAVGWRIAARRLGPGEGPFLARLEGSLDRAALFGLAGGLLFLASAWSVAA